GAAAGERGVGNATTNNVLPESPRGQRARNRAEAAAVTTDQFGELADPCRQHSFDALAQAPRQCWRASAGADRHHDLAAIDDRGKDESGKLGPVDNIDRDAVAARADGNLRVESLSRGNDGDDVAQIGRERIADADFKSPRSGERHDIFGNVEVARE